MSLKQTTDRKLDELWFYYTVYKHLISLFLREYSKYKSYFPFAYNDKTFSERVVGYAGALKNNNWSDSSFDEAFPIDVDIYICTNGMKHG